jgi:hypothetical protein
MLNQRYGSSLACFLMLLARATGGMFARLAEFLDNRRRDLDAMT